MTGTPARQMLSILLVLFASLLAQGAAVTPVQKVLQMMGDMKAKALKEKQNEIVMMTKFTQFCEDTSVEKSRAIKDGQDQVDKLSADIQKFDSDAKVLGQEIAKLSESIGDAEADKTAATEVRTKEKADYQKTHADYVESIGDLEGAISKVKKMMSSVPGASAASLLQAIVAKGKLPSHAQNVVTAFMAEASNEDRMFAEGIEVSAPEGKVYESQSGGIVDMMEKLKDKLMDEKTTLEQEEMKAQSSFDMMAQSLTGTISQQTDGMNQKTATKKQMEESSAQAKGDLADTSATLAEDQKYLADLTQTCQQKQQDFEARQKMRAEELGAIDQAMEIISSGAVSGSAGKHLPTLLQIESKPTQLAQLRSNVKNPSMGAVSSYLRSQGQRIGSNILSALALRADSDPFAKVVKMIQDMIVKLTEEANEEAEHKGFCDSELSSNKQTRDEKSSQADELNANIEQMSAESEKLATEISELSEDIAATDAAVAKATANRAEEKEKNSATIADAQVATAAVEKALQVLKDFYDKASSATALVQTSASRAPGGMPETFDEPFTGTGGGGGIIGMLEVILSDFERLESETTESESSAQAEYEKFTADSAEDKATKSRSVKDKTTRKTQLDSDTAQATKDLKATQEELDAALAYFEKLKPSCLDAGESYEERVARRNEEIESLQDALKILNGDA